MIYSINNTGDGGGAYVYPIGAPWVNIFENKYSLKIESNLQNNTAI